MNTVKLTYQTSKESKDIILKYIKNQNNVIRFMYNRLQDDKDLKQTELTHLANSMNNIFVDSWFKQCAIYKARELSDKKNVIFGGKKLFFDRLTKKISKEKFQIKRLVPLYLIGDASLHGNRKFVFDVIENNKLIFKPKYKTKIDIQLPKLRKNYKKILYKLEELADEKKLPITISLDLEYIYITYDETFLKENTVKIKNRIMSTDLNPNYIGYSIIDWINENEKIIVKTGCISLKKINDKQFALKKLKISSDDDRMKYLVNKRHFEIFEISKYLVSLAKQYRVEKFGIEGLDIESSDKCKGVDYNRLINNMWYRNKLIHNLMKRCKLNNTAFYDVPAWYSSFIGNIMNREYFDPIAASIEINRRTYKLSNKQKPVVFPDFSRATNVITKSLEEFSNGLVKLVDVKSWKELYIQVKNSKLKYRVSLSDELRVFSLFNKKSLVYQF